MITVIIAPLIVVEFVLIDDDAAVAGAAKLVANGAGGSCGVGVSPGAARTSLVSFGFGKLDFRFANSCS